MAGEDVDADAGAGQDDEALPDVVHVSASGLGAGDPACPAVELDAPQPQSSPKTKVSKSRRIFFLMERRAGQMITNLGMTRRAGTFLHI